MPSRYVGTKLQNPEIIRWLESRASISDTVREALIRMKQGEELSEDLVRQLATLATATSKVSELDKHINELLQFLLDKPQ
jgi:uncharacterized membrane protein affecting hemolysin expression